MVGCNLCLKNCINATILDDYNVLDRRGRFNTPTEASGEPSSTTSTPHHLTAPTTISIKKEADKVEPGMGKG